MCLILNQLCEIIRQRYPDHWKTRISFVLMGISGAAADLDAYLNPTPEDPFFFLNDEDLAGCVAQPVNDGRYKQISLLDDCA